MKMYKTEKEGIYQKVKDYLVRGGLSAVILLTPNIAMAKNSKTVPVKKGGIEYVFSELGNEVAEFGQNLGKLVDIIHKQPTVDQLIKNKNAKVNDYLAKGVTFVPSLFIDPVYGTVALVQNPGKALEDTVKGAIENPIETGLRVVGYAVIGKAIHDSHGHGRGGAGGEQVPPGAPEFPPGPGVVGD